MATLVSPKEAVNRAIQYIKDFYPTVSDILLEEIELGEDNNWYITLSFRIPASNPLAMLSKEYKQFKISSTTGEVLSMKIRTVK